MGAVPLAIELGARSIDHLESTGPEGVAALGTSDCRGGAASGRRADARTPAAAGARARRRGCDRGARDRLQPGERLLREPAGRLQLACTQLGMTPEEALAACTVNAAHVLGRADRIGRLAPGFDGRRRPARGHRLAAPRVSLRWRRRPHGGRAGGSGVATGIIRAMANEKQRRRRAKEKRHAYDLVEIDSEGNETVLTASDAEERGARRKRRALRSPRPRPHVVAFLSRRAGRAWRSGRRSSFRSSLRSCCCSEAARSAIVQCDRQRVLLLALFIPLSYVMDSFVYRTYQKRLAKSGSR